MRATYPWLLGVVLGLSAYFYAQLSQAEVPVIDESIHLNPQNAMPAAEPNNEDFDTDEDEVPTRSRNVTTPPAKQVNAIQADLLSQMDGLHQEINELRGQVEMNTHQIQTLTQKLSSTSAAANASTTSDNAKAANAIQADSKELAAYQKGYDAIKAKDFDRAKTAFTDYLSDYNNGAYAGNAHYWLGEIYLHQDSLSRATNEFNQVLSNPKNAKYPDAMLKMGLLYAKQNSWDQARKQLNQVVQQFPGSTAATLANAKLQELTQQGH